MKLGLHIGGFTWPGGAPRLTGVIRRDPGPAALGAL